jgi:hypothetical protein
MYAPGAGTLAFAIRSGVNLILFLARIRNLPRCVSTRGPSEPKFFSEALMLPQEDAYFAHTTCCIRSRLVPFRCHAWFAPVFISHSPSWGAHSKFSGSFVALYRILLNAFPLLFPANIPIHLKLRSLTKRLTSAPDFRDSAVEDSSSLSVERDSLPDNPPVAKRAARLSSAAQAHQIWLRKRSARWHSIVAGAVAGGVAISFENPLRRKVIAQQLFVR